MPRFKLMASYGYVGTETDLGDIEDVSEDEAQDEAWTAACERVDSWVVEITPRTKGE